MEFMMFVATDPGAEPYDPDGDNIGEWVDEMTRRGIWISGNRLRPPEDATTVRVRGGETLITDGPFTESKEWIAGYDLLEVEHLDEAIDIARAGQLARFGAYELRPVWPLEQEV